jgi:dephospho-CoA kinase
MIRVGLVGPMMSGKTTVAQMLEKHGFTNVALADALKDDCATMLNDITAVIIRREGFVRLSKLPYVTRDSINKNKGAYRPLLQWYGTDFWRTYREQPEFWLQRLAKTVDQLADKDPNRGVTTDDVRFINEAAFLRQRLGYILVRIHRPEEQRMALLRETYPDPDVLNELLNHQSETASKMIEADFTLYNRSSLENLEKDVVNILLPTLKELHSSGDYE